jgi:hypothetical protein
VSRVILGFLLATGEVGWNSRVLDQPGTFLTPPRCAFTPQVPRLCRSLRDNLHLARSEDPTSVGEVLRASVLDDDVAGFKRGLDTLVGSRGATSCRRRRAYSVLIMASSAGGGAVQDDADRLPPGRPCRRLDPSPVQCPESTGATMVASSCNGIVADQRTEPRHAAPVTDIRRHAGVCSSQTRCAKKRSTGVWRGGSCSC